MKWMTKYNFLKFQSGFSLMELMTVIGIIGIMAAIGIPKLTNSEHRSSKAARELMGNIQQTRMSAIKDNQEWAVVFDPATNNYYICSDRGGDNAWSAIGDNTIEKTGSFTGYGAGVQYGSGIATAKVFDDLDPSGAFGTGVTYNSNVLTFNSRGTCSAGYVYLFYGDASYAVGTLLTGIVKLRRWSGGGWN
jgi:prepilin-type N-terminal cleavage/methylation domain-containing protein